MALRIAHIHCLKTFLELSLVLWVGVPYNKLFFQVNLRPTHLIIRYFSPDFLGLIFLAQLFGFEAVTLGLSIYRRSDEVEDEDEEGQKKSEKAKGKRKQK